MASLGNYIHYYWSNYVQYGTNRKGNSNYGLAITIFQNEKNEMVSKFEDKKNTKQLEEALNGMMYPTTSEYDIQANSKMQKYLRATLAGMLTKWASQEGLGMKGHHSNKDSFKFGEVKGYSLPNIRDLQTRAKKSLQLISKYAASGNEILIQQLNQIISLTQEAQTVAKSYLNKNEFASYAAMSRSSVNTKNKYQNIIRQINDTLSLLSTASINEAAGTAWEHAIATLDDRVANVVNGTSIKLIKENIVTGNKTDKITLSGFDPYMKKVKGIISKYKDPKTGATVEFKENGTTATQGVVYKMDVNLQYQEEQFRISAKNYSLDKFTNIHLVQETPLLTSLMRNVSNDFINHSMNILLAKQGDSNQKNLQKNANCAIKDILKIEALTGISQKNGYADTLVINNRSQKKVRVIPMKKLINLNNGFTFSGYSALTEGINEWEDGNRIEGANRNWLSSKVRVDKLLAKIHKIKISISLNYNKIP